MILSTRKAQKTLGEALRIITNKNHLKWMTSTKDFHGTYLTGTPKYYQNILFVLSIFSSSLKSKLTTSFATL